MALEKPIVYSTNETFTYPSNITHKFNDTLESKLTDLQKKYNQLTDNLEGNMTELDSKMSTLRQGTENRWNADIGELFRRTDDTYNLLIGFIYCLN